MTIRGQGEVVEWVNEYGFLSFHVLFDWTGPEKRQRMSPPDLDTFSMWLKSNWVRKNETDGLTMDKWEERKEGACFSSAFS